MRPQMDDKIKILIVSFIVYLRVGFMTHLYLKRFYPNNCIYMVFPPMCPQIDDKIKILMVSFIVYLLVGFMTHLYLKRFYPKNCIYMVFPLYVSSDRW